MTASRVTLGPAGSLGGERAARLLAVLDDIDGLANRRIAKAETDSARFIRDRLQEAVMPNLVDALERYFVGLARRLGAGNVSTIAKADDYAFFDRFDWDGEERHLRRAMLPALGDMLTGGRLQAEEALALADAINPSRASVGLAGSLSLGDYDLSIRRQIGLRITAINETTRARVQGIVARGIEQGLSPRKIARGTIEFDGIRSYVAQTYRNRARVIALTETANAYNLGQIQGYRSAGIEKVRIFDGDDCGWTAHDDSDAAAGSIRTLEEAESQPTAHPNCQRSWSPYFAGEEQTGVNRPETTTATQDIVTTQGDQYSGPLNVSRLDSAVRNHAWDSQAKAAGYNSTDEFVAATEQRMTEVMATAEPRIRITPDGLRGVLRDGRMKTQFETGSSRGAYDPSLRASVESELWDIPVDYAATKRAIYGYLESPHDVAGGGVQQYGGLVVRLKPAVRQRTTFTMSDSLGGDMVPSPINAPRAASLRPGQAAKALQTESRNINEYFYGKAGYSAERVQSSYIEAQVHGGVAVDDMAEVLVPITGQQSPATVLGQEVMDGLARAGIPVRPYRLGSDINALTGDPL